MKAKILLLCLLITIVVFPAFSFAHPGRTAADGCHYCRTNCDSWGVPWNERHCHNGGGAPAPVVQEVQPIYIPPTKYIPPPSRIPTRISYPTSTPRPTSTIIPSPTKRSTPKPTRIVKPKRTYSIVPTQRLIQQDTNTTEQTTSSGNGLLRWLISLFK